MNNETEELAPMDQSYERPTPDTRVRLFALQLAQAANQTPNGHPSFVIPTAREVYLFITGKDPVVDVVASAGPNVIALGDYYSAGMTDELEGDD